MMMIFIMITMMMVMMIVFICCSSFDYADVGSVIVTAWQGDSSFRLSSRSEESVSLSETLNSASVRVRLKFFIAFLLRAFFLFLEHDLVLFNGWFSNVTSVDI